MRYVAAAVLSLGLCAAMPASAQIDFPTRAQDKTPFGMPAQEQALIANVCGTQLPALGAVGCACVAERAMTALDQPQRSYLILSVVQPPAADRTDTAKSPADIRTIAAFIDSAGKNCATETAPAPAAPEPVTPSGDPSQ